MHRLYLLIVCLMIGDAHASNSQRQGYFHSHKANLIVDCPLPPEIPSKGSSYRELESWAALSLQSWAECASNKKALVDSWLKLRNKMNYTLLQDEISNDPAMLGYSTYLPDSPGRVIELLNTQSYNGET